MRATLGLLSLVLLVGTGTASGADAPLLTKTYQSGYTPAEWARPARCDVYTDKVVIERRYGDVSDKGFVAREEKAIQIMGGIDKVIQAAQSEKLTETENSMCDGPEWQASAGNFVLYGSGGCGTPRKDRKGPNSRMLIDLVNIYCPIGN